MVDRRKASPLVFLFASALVSNPLAGSFAHAEMPTARPFAEVVRNVKETNSILLDGELLEESHRLYPLDDTGVRARLTSAFTILANSFDSPGVGNSVCEPKFLSRLQTLLLSEKLPSNRGNVRDALLALREANLIDDVALRPLLATYPAWAALGYREKDWIVRDADGTASTIACPTDTYLPLLGSVREKFGRGFKRKHLRARIEQTRTDRNPLSGVLVYRPIQTEWFGMLDRVRYDRHTEFALAPVLLAVAEAKNRSPRADPNEPPTKLLAKRKPKGRGLSNRLSLYARFNGRQIMKLVERYQVFTERSDIFAVAATLVLRYTDGRPDELISLDPNEQYRMAAKLLHRELSELSLSALFKGQPVTFDDLVIANIEAGFVRAAEVDAALGVDDLWNPKVTGWNKVLKIVQKYGSTALVLIPNPFSFWASLALVLSTTILSQNTSDANDPVDQGTSIF